MILAHARGYTSLVQFFAMSSLGLYPSLCVLLFVSAAVRTARGVFSVMPNSTYGIVEGGSLTVACDSDSAAYYVWRREGELVEGDSIAGLMAVGGTLTISNANRSLHSGNYRCIVVEHDSTELMASFTVSVYYIGSEILVERTYRECIPDNNTAYFGASLTLDCLVASGNPPVNVTWFLNGSPVDHSRATISQGGRRLVVSDLMGTDAGYYHCEAGNTAGHLISEDLRIRVAPHTDNGAEEVVVEMYGSDQPLVVGEGQNATLICKIFPPIDISSVLWMHNGNILSPEDGQISVQNSHPELTCINYLHFTNIGAGDEGIYECLDVDSIDDHHALRQLLLAMLEGPLVVEATPTKLLAADRSLTLTCRLSNTADMDRNNVSPEDFTYLWSHNGSASLGPGVEEVGGGRQLVISQVTLEDSGLYVCSVGSDKVPTVISASVNITVEVAPRVTISLLGSETDSIFDSVVGNVVFVQLGARVTFQCKIHSARASNFTWFRKVNGVLELFSVSTSLSLNSTLILSPLTPSHLTSYACHVSNPVHNNLVSEERTLAETSDPYVRDAAVGVQDVKFHNGTTLELVCEARGRSGDVLVWMSGGRELTNQTTAGGSLVIAISGNNSTLTIFGVTTREAGLYQCAMEGTMSKLTYNVTVTVPAKIDYTSNPFVTVAVGDQVQFDCVASGIPLPSIGWLFDTQPVEEVDTLQDLGNGSLRISSATRDHEGRYHCFLALENGETREFTLTVEEGVQQDELLCGSGLTRDDCITLLSGGSMAVFLLLLTLFVFLLCFCILCRRWTRGAYEYPRDFEMKRDFSSRASSHKESGAVPVFEDLNGFSDPQGFRNGLYPVHPPMATFDRMAMSDMQRSVTPPAPSPVLQTPGTGGTDSMFSSDDQSSLTATLPNYPRAKLTLGDELGEGEFGPVLLGVARNIVSHEETTQVVVKVLVRSGDGEGQFQPDLALVDFANQMKIDYEHIACILGLCTDTEPYYVIYEYLDQGDLKKYLMANRPVAGQPTNLSPHVLSRLVLQVADGMAFLFSQRIIHGDLATRNCLVSSDCHIKIADLGIGHDLYQTDYYDNGSQLLPIRWMPPELLVATDDGPAFSLHSDIWSFGVLCWEVFTFGQLPFEGVADEEVLVRVPEGLTLQLPPSPTCPDHMIRAMAQCWQRNPESRPRFSALCMEMNVIAGE